MASDSAGSWAIPGNPSYYDVVSAFNELEAIEWRQTTYVQAGDTVYIYVANPVKAIMFKYVAEETDLYGEPEIDDRKFFVGEPPKENKRHMRLKLLESYDSDKYPLSVLKKHGLTNVQGPRKIPAELEEYFESQD